VVFDAAFSDLHATYVSNMPS